MSVYEVQVRFLCDSNSLAFGGVYTLEQAGQDYSKKPMINRNLIVGITLIDFFLYVIDASHNISLKGIQIMQNL